MATARETKSAELTTKRTALADYFKSHTKAEGLVLDAAQVEEIRTKNAELEALGVEVKNLTDVEEIQAKNLAKIAEDHTPTRPGGYSKKGRISPNGMGNDGAMEWEERPNLGRILTESKSYKERGSSRSFSVSAPDIETKTLFATTAGWDPFVTRLPRVALSPQQQPKIVDAFPSGTTNQHSIKFMLETVYTNNAAETAEAGLYNEAVLQLAEQIAAIQKLTVFLPITDEQLDDEDGARDYVNSRLDLMLRQRIDSQLVNGNGTAPNLLGIKNINGIQTAAKVAGDSTIDTILKAIVSVQTVGFSDPSVIMMNPTDWMNIRLLRTTDGLYIWGHPSMVGPATLWGLPVVASTYITLASAYVADLVGNTMLFYRKGIEFLISNSHADFFANGKQAIRADLRCGLVCFRPKAIFAATGL